MSAPLDLSGAHRQKGLAAIERLDELGHKLKLSAASRCDAPASTASITRSRKSSEYGFGIAWPP
jgi:hypothetical protein